MVAAQAAFSQVGRGQFSRYDKCFFPENVVLGSVAYRIRLLMGAEHLVVRGRAGEADVTLFLVDGVVAALVQGKRPALSGWRRCAGPRRSRIITRFHSSAAMRTAGPSSRRPGLQR